MLRNKEIGASAFVKKFNELEEKLSSIEKSSLDLGYYRDLEAYIERLYRQTVLGEDFGDERLDEIREAEMSNLNRLQKLKNSSSYKKAKHKRDSEDWE